MATSYETYQKRRLITSYFSVVLSIALVLFLLGLLGMLVLNAKKVSDYFKEQVEVHIFLKDEAKDVEIKQLEKSLMMNDYVKSTEYVSKEQAAESVKAQNGEDFMDFLGFNPLQNHIDVVVKPDFVNVEQLEILSNDISEKSFVDEVRYDKDLVAIMNKNVKKISFWILVISILFTVIAVLLINSSIRLSIYSKRFTIKTMQMVGATKQFIRRPFVWNSIKLGIIGAIVALLGMAFVLYYVNKSFPELEFMSNQVLIAILFVSVFVVGIIITWISTHIATQRFLNLNTDALYY